MSGYTNEELRRAAVRAESALGRVYRELGPRNQRGRLVSARIFAKMSRKQIAETWDFPNVRLLYAIAKVIAQ